MKRDLFTKGSHHKNISVMFITQNIFHKSTHSRDISLNASYIVLFKNPRDRAQIQHLVRQIYPEDSKFLQEAYQDATAKGHGYIEHTRRIQIPLVHFSGRRVPVCLHT